MDPTLRQRLDTLIDAELSSTRLVEEFSALCDALPDSAWDILALVDQYYRRGKLSVDVYRTVRAELVPHILGKPAAAAVVAATDEERIRSELLAERQDLKGEPAAIEAEWRSSRVGGSILRLWAEAAITVALIGALMWGLHEHGVAARLAERAAAHAESVLSTSTDAGRSAVASEADGPARARIALGADRYIAFPGRSSAIVDIRRVGASAESVTFMWWTRGGGAIPGKDYAPVKPRLETFPAGVGELQLSVEILANPTRKHTELFYVVIGKPGPGAELGPTTRAPVFIMSAG